jgi:hypothetical protein
MPSRRETKAMAPEASASAEPPRKRTRLTQPIDVDALLLFRPPAFSYPYIHSFSDESDDSTSPVAFLTPEGPPSPTTSEINKMNNAEFNQALRDGLRMHQKNQRPNTRKAYKGPQKKWMAWCNEKKFSDGYIIKNKKFLAFVQQVIMTRRVEKKKRRKVTAKKEKFDEIIVENKTDAAFVDGLQNLDLPDPELHEGVLFKYYTVRSYVSAIIELYQIQIAQNINPYQTPRNMAVKGFLRSIRNNVWKTTGEAHEDRALNSVINNYNYEDMFAFVRNCFRKEKSHKRHLRTALDFLIGHYFLLRGDNRRKLELADLNVIDLLDESHQPCKTWMAIFDNGKTNFTNKKQYIGVMRHKNHELCAQGMLAQYLFHRYQIQKET